MNYKKISTWFIIAGVLVISIIYGISFFLSFFSNPEQQLAKDIFQKQMDRELAKGPNKKLADLNAEAKKRHLTATEEDEIVAKTEEAEMIRKKYGSKLTPPLKPASVKPKEEVIITKPVSNDLLTGAYLSWQKPDDYAGKKPEIREAVFGIKITRLDNEKLVFLDSNRKDTTDCTWKEESKKYQGQWEKDGKVGFIEFTPIYKNGKIVSFCGAMGSKNKKPNSFCWITGGIP